ncbi:hypothetical protein D3C81_2222610 [compost metagenome]
MDKARLVAGSWSTNAIKDNLPLLSVIGPIRYLQGCDVIVGEIAPAMLIGWCGVNANKCISHTLQPLLHACWLQIDCAL